MVVHTVEIKTRCFLPSKQIQKKWDQNDKADPEKQPALEEGDLKPAEGETQVDTNTREEISLPEGINSLTFWNRKMIQAVTAETEYRWSCWKSSQVWQRRAEPDPTKNNSNKVIHFVCCCFLPCDKALLLPLGLLMSSYIYWCTCYLIFADTKTLFLH